MGSLQKKIYKNFKNSWKSLVDLKKQIIFVIILFMFSLICAFIFPIPFVLEEQLTRLIRDLILRTQGLNGLGITSFIFSNNFYVSIISIFSGILFCIIPAFITLSNGYILGYVSKMVIMEKGILELWRILPHGIFELPAIVIALGLGIKMGQVLVLSLNKNSFKDFFNCIKNSIKIIFFVIMPLLVIAAIIEGLLITFMK